jgi:type I restriction enzyme, S subunit
MNLAQLSDVCEFIKDGTHGSPPRTRDGIPVLSAEHVFDGALHFSTQRFASKEELEVFRKRLYPRAGDVLLTIVGTIGRAALVRDTRPCIFQRSICVFRPECSVLDPSYLRFALESDFVQQQLERETRQVAQAGVYLEALNKILIPVRTLKAQKRVARVLEQADRLRRIRRYALELGNVLLPAAFLKMFGDPEADPHQWPQKKLGELCAKVIDCPHATPTYAPTRTRHACIRSSDIQNGFLDFTDTKYVDFSEYKRRIERGKPMRGDVIYCREGARFGNAGRVLDDSNLCLGQRMMLFRANTTLATSEFIWAFLSSRNAYQQASRVLDGSASPHVNVGEIIAFQVFLPPLELQQQFTAMVERFERLRAVHREALRQAEHLFQTLLHRAFTTGL